MTLERRILSIDCDGVLANFNDGYREVINSIYPEKKVPKGFTPNDWDWTEYLKKEEVGALWERIKATPQFWFKLGEYEDNVSSLYKILNKHREYFDVYYITSRMDTGADSALAQTSAWLCERALLDGNCSVIVVRDAAEKIAMLKGIGAHASIDDYLPTVHRANAIPGHQAYLHRRSWNNGKEHTWCEHQVDCLREFLTAQVIQVLG